jgi:tetratricopeptide (TPR) repeat protein
MTEADLVFIHGFWSSPKTWTALKDRFEEDDELRGVHVHEFSYDSPKLPPLPLSTTRIPEYDDIAQTLAPYLDVTVSTDATAIVTHSQGGLILQRFLAWMLNNGRGRELSRIKLIVMLACPNQGSDYLRSIRKMAGFGRRPQARELKTLSADVATAGRFVLHDIARADTVDDHHCKIPIYVYAGSSDNVVNRVSGQGLFQNAQSLPGNHFTILRPDKPGNITFPTLKRHVLKMQQAEEARATEENRLGQQIGGPSNLELATGFFTGRSNETAEIEAAVDGSDPRQAGRIIAIHGMPGIGKTALALHVAHRMIAKYSIPVKQAGLDMFVSQIDLHGHDGLARTDPEFRLSELLSTSFSPKRLPGDLDGLKQEWRRHLAGKFTVLLLDDAEDALQVTPFLPSGSGHVVLVTSRRPLGDLVSWGAKLMSLTTLTEADSVRLIEKVTDRTLEDRDRHVVEDIAELCGHHPQAMRLAVAGLEYKRKISFTDRLAQLKAVPNRLLAVDQYADAESGTVARSFELSYTQLTSEGQLLLRRLGLAPVSTVTSEAAAALVGQDPATTGPQLRALDNASLIEEDRTGYRLHDLIRQYALSLAAGDDPAENTAAVDRMLAYHLDAAAYVDSMFTRQPPPPALESPPPPFSRSFADRDSALAWAHDQRENLEACAAYAGRQANDTGHRQAKAWVILFASALAGLLRNDGQWRQSIDQQTRAIIAAQQLGLPLAEANARHERGQLYRLSSALDDALIDLETALVLYREEGGEAGETGEAHALNTSAVVLDQLGRRSEAWPRFDASLAIYRRRGDRLGEANVLHDQGMTQYFSGHDAEAAESLAVALELFKAVDHPLGQAHAHSNLAKAQRRLGLANEAAEHLLAAETYYRRLGNQLGVVTTITEEGTVRHEQGDHVGAELNFRDAERLAEEIGSMIGLAAVSKTWGSCWAETGDLKRAEALLTRSLELYRRYGIQRDEDQLVKQLKALGLPDGGGTLSAG